MDLQRIILLSGIGIISYMIIWQWQQDYITTTIEPAQVASVSAYDNGTIAADFPLAENNTIDTTTDTITTSEQVSSLDKCVRSKTSYRRLPTATLRTQVATSCTDCQSRPKSHSVEIVSIAARLGPWQTWPLFFSV